MGLRTEGMILLVTGLALFLVTHSVRIVADAWRANMIARIGLRAWKVLYSLVSFAGFVMIAWGYGEARVGGTELWYGPAWLRYTAGFLMLLSFVLLAAANVPRNRIKAAIGHPMIASVAIWAFAHLLVNARVADLVLFGTFLVWSAIDFYSARRRERVAGTPVSAGTWVNTAMAPVFGIVIWALFAGYLHRWLIGVAVM